MTIYFFVNKYEFVYRKKFAKNRNEIQYEYEYEYVLFIFD